MRKLSWLALAAFVLAVNTHPSLADPAWKCGKKRCFWVEGYKGPLPDFAARWGQPSQPGCYYVLRRSKRWLETCPFGEMTQRR
jgi:hypothetical protein